MAGEPVMSVFGWLAALAGGGCLGLAHGRRAAGDQDAGAGPVDEHQQHVRELLGAG
jgi:hypothetical protein